MRKIKKLSIIIPIYNERKTLLKLLRRIEKVKLGGIKKEIILVDDGSTDGTCDLLKKIRRHKILYHKENQGKGTAIRTGLKQATGDVILIQDADLEYCPTDYPKLLKPIVNGKAKVVYGSRYLTGTHLEIPLHWIGNKLLIFFTNFLFHSRITDMETCYKVFTRDIIKGVKLKAKKFDFEPEITAKILKKGHKINEVSIKYKCRRFDEGKKITWIDGVKALYYLIKYRFTN